MIRYYFKSKPDSAVKLQFYTAAGDSIITYSSVKDNKGKMIPVSKDFYPNPKKTPSGLLKAGAGMNLFVWTCATRMRKLIQAPHSKPRH